MRAFLPSKNRPASITTPALAAAAGLDYYVVLHSEDQRDAYAAAGRVDPDRLIVSGVPGDTFGLSRQREWICDNLAAPGEWFLFADDDIEGVQAVPAPHYQESILPLMTGEPAFWKALYETPCPPERLVPLLEDMRARADDLGVHLCGFATNDNYYWRPRHWSYWTYVLGAMMLWHNVGVPFDHTISMEDYNYTAEHLYRFGRVLVNHFVRPTTRHYQPGGMGLPEERRAQREADVAALRQKWPGLFAVKTKGVMAGADLRIVLRGQQRIDLWRRGLLRQNIGLSGPLSRKVGR